MAEVEDQFLQDVVLITELPTNSWVEGYAPIPDGYGMVTRIDLPEIHTINPRDPDDEPLLLHEWDEDQASGIVNICAIIGKPYEYAVITGKVDLNAVQFENPIIWRMRVERLVEEHPASNNVHVNGDGVNGEHEVEERDIKPAISPRPPRYKTIVNKIVELPEATSVIGITPVTERLVLIADSKKGCITRLDLMTGAYSLLLQHESMQAATDEDFFGINRMRVAGGYVWFTNSSAGTLCRFPVKVLESCDPQDDEDWGLHVLGPIEVVCDDIVSCDGLAISRDLTVAYCVNYMVGYLWKIDVDPCTGKGKATTILENLVSPTHVELLYPEDENRKPSLLVVCGGTIEVGWANEADGRPWTEFANIEAKITISVVTEVIESP